MSDSDLPIVLAGGDKIQMWDFGSVHLESHSFCLSEIRDQIDERVEI